MGIAANNSDLFGNTVERIHSVFIKENKDKDVNSIKTYSFETIFTNSEGYTYKLTASKVKFKNYSMTEESNDYFIYGKNGDVVYPNSPSTSKTSISLLLDILVQDGMYTKYEIVDITNYHQMSLKQIEKELGYKIKLTEK